MAIDSSTGIVDKFGLPFGSENPLYEARIVADPALTADRKLTLPDKDGTLATLSDVGGTTWDYELTNANDLTGLTDNAYLDDFRVQSLPYGLYVYEAFFTFEDAGGSPSSIGLYVGWNAGEAYPSVAVVVQGFIGNGAGPLNINGWVESDGNLLGNSSFSPNANQKAQVFVSGYLWHHKHSSFYGDDFRPMITLTSGTAVIKAGATMKLRKFADEAVGYVA